MINYKDKKEKAKRIAISWQLKTANNNHSLQYYVNWRNRFHKIGKKYGLLHEFRENAII